MASDFALLDRWKGGDAAAGNELFERHFAGVYRFFSHKVEREGDVADLTQRTFLACVESVHRFRSEASFRTFLFGIARNELFHHYRDRRRQPDLDAGASSVRDLGPSPSTLMHKNAEERVLLEALRAIPLDAQILLELHYWEEMTGAELAQILDVPEGTVRSRLGRARHELARRFSELSPAGLRSTPEDLEDWARSLQTRMALLAEPLS